MFPWWSFDNNRNNHTTVTDTNEPSITTVNHGPITITENKAPTDASVRLLQEMQEKALQSIIKSLKVDSNSLRAQAFIYVNNMNMCHDVIIKYLYNGHERYVKYSFDASDSAKGMDYIINGLVKTVAEDFAKVIITSSLPEIFSDFSHAVNKGV